MLKLYLVQLDSILHNQDYLHALPYATQLQINNYKSEQAKKQKIGSVLLMNYLLNKYRVDVRLLKISEYGKPYVSGNKIHFNISHSGNYLICGVSNYEIGVDIECVNPRLKTIKSMFLSQSEQKTHLHSSDSKLTQI
jgi:4'-phosphopantetheinyl transferase